MFLRCCLFQVMSVMLTMRVAASIPGWTNCIEIAPMSFQIGKQSREPISFSQKKFSFLGSYFYFQNSTSPFGSKQMLTQ